MCQSQGLSMPLTRYTTVCSHCCWAAAEETSLTSSAFPWEAAPAGARRHAPADLCSSSTSVDVWEGRHTFTPLRQHDAVTILLTLLMRWLPSSALKIAPQPFRARLIKVWLCLLRVACRVWEAHWDLGVFRCVKYPASEAESAAIYSLNALWRLPTVNILSKDLSAYYFYQHHICLWEACSP